MSAGGAAITRCLAPFYDENTDPAAWGQTETRQLESLGFRVCVIDSTEQIGGVLDELSAP